MSEVKVEEVIINGETLQKVTNRFSIITCYYSNASGQLHNPGGPALYHASGDKYYYLNGKELSKEDFEAFL